jgi:ribosome-associated toxin RatA of RatAB toxin-antitoxin module
MPKTERTIIINAPPEKCYEVIVDLERYPDFVTETKGVKIIKREGKNKVQAEFTVKVIKEVSYTLDLWGVPNKSWDWKLVKGFMKKNNGGWRLKDLGQGRTEATYNVDVEFGLLVPSAVIKMLQENQLPKMLETFKKRIESLK